MALPSISVVAVTSSPTATPVPQKTFAEVLGPARSPALAPSEVSSRPVAQHSALAHPISSSQTSAAGIRQVQAHPSALPPKSTATVEWVEGVAKAQKQLDVVLKLAESGKTFSPAELLVFQTQVYRASQQLDLAGKVVEKATAGVKQVLQTQV